MTSENTYEAILSRLLNNTNIPADVDKREGSILYLALAPAAAELAQAYVKLENIENRTYADTAVGDDLKRRAAERGIIKNSATYAIRKGTFNIDIPIGTRFKGGDYNFVVTEKIVTGQFKLQCETAGEVGNSYSGTLIPVDYIDGLKTATLSDILIPGEDDETDISLRARYFDSFENDSFGGNISDYKIKTNELTGVGGTKVIPVWNGGGTVKLVIIDSNYKKPSLTLVDTVQTAIDPIQNQGKGLGIAPIGHVVTVIGVSEVTVNIASNITLKNGYVWADVLPSIMEAIKDYLTDLNRTWEDNESIIVRISQIETRVLAVTGVLDIQNTLINSLSSNLVLGENEIPVLGGITQT
jgi:uncharacterized phage protein gp47/JayE